MKRILITGATGNIGTEVISSLYKSDTKDQIIAGVRNIDKARQTLNQFQPLNYVDFDFENPLTFDNSLENIDLIFLLRPPQISDVDKFFKPLIRKISEKGIKKIIFLSVQGAEKSKVIPHNKIERLIRDSELDFIFLRPSYFMQNLTTTLLKDIQTKRKIILPAGKAKFNWIDIKNIAEVTARLLDDFETYKNNEIELTGPENLDFYSVVDLINEVTSDKIEYTSVSPITFFKIKKHDGFSNGLTIVMTMLHFLPRLQKEPIISDFYEYLTGLGPTTLKEFVNRERKNWNAL
jgi:uncharacterized protein YbjT (DUF2867 family)